MTDNIIAELTEVLLKRKAADADQSYVASLYQAGTNKILEKVGEEAAETIIAAKDLAALAPESDAAAAQAARTDLTKEVADLWFHSMVLLCHLDLTPSDVLQELGERFGVGGHAEKAARSGVSSSTHNK